MAAEGLCAGREDNWVVGRTQLFPAKRKPAICANEPEPAYADPPDSDFDIFWKPDLTEPEAKPKTTKPGEC